MNFTGLAMLSSATFTSPQNGRESNWVVKLIFRLNLKNGPSSASGKEIDSKLTLLGSNQEADITHGSRLEKFRNISYWISGSPSPGRSEVWLPPFRVNEY